MSEADSQNKGNIHTKGQSSRQKNENGVMDILEQYLPIKYEKIIAKISRTMHLCPDTVKYSYLQPLFVDDVIRNSLHDIVYFSGKTNPEIESSQKEIIVDSEVEKINNLRKVKPFLDLGNDLQDYLRTHKEKSRKEQIGIIKKAPINETLRRVWLKDLGVI